MTFKENLLQRIAQRVIDDPDGLSFIFVQRYDEDGETLSWSQLWNRACYLAEQMDIQGETKKAGVLVFCANEKNFVVSLLAVWMRGAVAIPAIATLQKGVVARNQHIIEQSKPDMVLYDLPEAEVANIVELAPQAVMLPVAGIDDNSIVESRSKFSHFSCEPGHLLQFTSGSTSKPKPVYLDATKVAENCSAIEQAYSLSNQTIAVHWLPLFHDMGLIGSCISAMWTGCLSILLRPSVFIQRPLVWLQYISQWRATITSAPNFAYERLCQILKPEDLNNLDLHCLENLIIGGEPVSMATQNKLLESLGAVGLSPSALAPSYGMAEATLLVSSGKCPSGPVYSATHSDTPITGLGMPVDCVNISLRDEQTGEQVNENSLGEIWISGKSVGHVIHPNGDWRDYQETVSDENKINTGDYGYFENENLFITGRDSNKLIIRGRNIFAEDVELLAYQSQPEGLCAAIAAFGIDEQGSQGLVILIEKNKTDKELDLGSLNKAITSKLGIKPSKVLLLKRASLPRTSSGKIQRNLASKKFAAGKFLQRAIPDVIQTSY